MNYDNLLNRPMMKSDFQSLGSERWAKSIKELVREYRMLNLPVMNGSFAYSNLVEGPSQIFTCVPYRLWEYSSLLKELERHPEVENFIDIGGAASVLSYILCENGYSGTAVDLQPILVNVCNAVAKTRNLNLKAIEGDITGELNIAPEQFGLVTFISVLEHIPSEKYYDIFKNIYRLLKPRGIFYLTFDYGNYHDSTVSSIYGKERIVTSSSIGEIKPLCDIITGTGFKFLGNDPSCLPEEILLKKRSPYSRSVTLKYSMSIGAVDGNTPVQVLMKYFIKRIFRLSRSRSRFSMHNYFRLFLEKPS